MRGLLRRLSQGVEIDEPVALVAAHPDDEVLGLGGRLCRLKRLTVIHLTTGAPGGEQGAACAAIRAREVEEALRAVGAGGAPRRCYGLPDQQAIHHYRETVDRLADDLGDACAVFTHPYEHGHPDHDTAALAVSLACARLGMRGPAPARYEFASYHLHHGTPVYGQFWSDPETVEVAMTLSPGDLARKRAAADCFVSQRHVIARFPLAPERVRRAPRYDFGRPAPPGAALYDAWGWTITSRDWRAQAAQALAAFAPEWPRCG